MSQAGAVRWRIRRPQSSIEREVSANTLLVPMIVHTSAGTRRVAIDLRDQGDSYHDPALEWADSYVKRSLDPAVRHPAHVEPMGIHFPCRTSGATWPLIRVIAGQCAREGASGARRIWNYLHLPQPSWYEQLPGGAASTASGVPDASLASRGGRFHGRGRIRQRAARGVDPATACSLRRSVCRRADTYGLCSTQSTRKKWSPSPIVCAITSR